jgi:TRAP-type C4-dicarboxylate transport system permease small subunit
MIESVNAMFGRYLGWIIIIISFLVGYDTFMRYIFSSPSEWVQESSVYGFAIFALLGSGYVQLCKNHIRTDVISSQLSPRLQNYLNIFYFIPCSVFVIAMLIAGWDIFWMAVTQHHQRAGTLMWPLWPYLLALPIGTVLVLAQLIADLLKDVRHAVTRSGQEG